MSGDTPLSKDWAMLGFSTGVAASLLKTLANKGLSKLGAPTLQYGGLASGLVLGKKPKLGGLVPVTLKGADEQILANMVDGLAGGVFGATMAYMHFKMPPGHEVVKGTVAGALLMIGVIAGGHVLQIDNIPGIKAKQSLTLIASGAAFGALQGYILGRYGPGLVEHTSRPQAQRMPN